jgi:hypothetical protein
LEDFPEKALFLKEKLSLFQIELDKEKRPLGTMENIH